MSDQFARMRKHTPGPWNAVGDEIYGADGHRVAEAVRDIELVRAAPELLAARDALYRANIEATAAYDQWLTESKERGQKAEAERDALVQATGASSVLEAIGIIRGNKAQLDRLTTLRPASEWDGETYVLWWREWDVAGWALDSISDSQESFYWTPAFDAHLPRAGGCANSLGDGVVAPSLEPAHPLPTPTEPT